MATATPLRTVVIENGTIVKLLGAQGLQTVLQLLSTVKKAPAPGCRPCQKRQPQIDYGAAKRIIANLPDVEMNKVKQALNADRVVLIYTVPGNRQVTITR